MNLDAKLVDEVMSTLIRNEEEATQKVLENFNIRNGKYVRPDEKYINVKEVIEYFKNNK